MKQKLAAARPPPRKKMRDAKHRKWSDDPDYKSGHDNWRRVLLRMSQQSDRANRAKN
jgi:hypothetical protein